MNLSDERLDDAVNVAPAIHEVIFEDEAMRVLRVTVPSGASVAMHWHPRNINYVLSAGRLGFVKPDGSSVKVELESGQVTSSPEGSHAVKNLGNTELQTIQVEIKT